MRSPLFFVKFVFCQTLYLGRASYGSGGGSSRLFTNSSMGHGVRPQTSVGSGPTSRYASSGILERPTAQELHMQFGRMFIYEYCHLNISFNAIYFSKSN